MKTSSIEQRRGEARRAEHHSVVVDAKADGWPWCQTHNRNPNESSPNYCSALARARGLFTAFWQPNTHNCCAVLCPPEVPHVTPPQCGQLRANYTVSPIIAAPCPLPPPYHSRGRLGTCSSIRIAFATSFCETNILHPVPLPSLNQAPACIRRCRSPTCDLSIFDAEGKRPRDRKGETERVASIHSSPPRLRSVLLNDSPLSRSPFIKTMLRKTAAASAVKPAQYTTALPIEAYSSPALRSVPCRSPL
ncbi:hypothetical protein LSTR_LSTR006378 [Laodelphax striatellus]|uniref:Uncharacterized protein n=1 Tax=Laodelphax striatellus TaxID=195883 RepID=A0A482XDR1_LAOST|nr:hypothetical protein LSTR_LSTR006378 [Laodelphax striatellus]